MADFKTHIATSTLVGAAFGSVAYGNYDVPYPTCILAAGLCSVAGMLPDLDSDSGVPLRESLAFAAAVVPMLMLERFARLGWPPEMMVLAGGLAYLCIRFGVGWLLKKFTVHRGMFHSVPAVVIAGQLTALVCGSSRLYVTYFFAAAVMLGFSSHLVLDELWSVQWSRGRWRFKSSFGTALKFWGGGIWPNLAAYAQVGLLSYVMMHDPVWMEQFEARGENLQHVAELLRERLTR